MIVYAYYDPSPSAPPFQARFIRLWAQSWRKHGWTPRLLTERMAEEHPGYLPHCSQTAKAVFAVSYYDKPGMLVRANIINLGLKPKRLAAGGIQFYPGCVAISKKMIREVAKTRWVHTSLVHNEDFCQTTRLFSNWNPDDVLEALRC